MQTQPPLEERPQEPFRENTRAPLEVPVQLQFDSYGELEEGFTADVSLGGMFVRNRDPKPVGTLLRFEVDLATDHDAATGFAEVAWIRIRQTGFEKPSGMGIQFRYVDAESRRLLERAVRSAVRDFELQPEPEASVEGAPKRSEPASPPRPGFITVPKPDALTDTQPEEEPVAADATGPFGLSMWAIAIIVPLAILALGLFLLL